jgi:hypothetical protein
LGDSTLELDVRPFRYQFHHYLSMSHRFPYSCCLHACLLHSRSLCVALNHLLLHLHHHPSRLRIQCPKTPSLLLWGKVNVLVLPNIISVSLYLLILYLRHFLAFISHLLTVSIPNIVQDALYDSGWRQAMELEMGALHKNGMWELVPLLHGKQTIGCK